MILRRIARPLLAASFVTGGIDILRNPKAAVTTPAPVAPAAVTQKLPPSVSSDPEQLLKVGAAVQIAAGLMLATNRLPRVAAAVLAVTLVPTTLAAHRFWEAKDPRAARNQQQHFAKNLSLLGGLVIAAADTGGRPGLGWRARHAGTAVKAKAVDALPVG